MEHFARKVLKKLHSVNLNAVRVLQNFILGRLINSRIREYSTSRQNQIHPFILESLKLIETDVAVTIYPI